MERVVEVLYWRWQKSAQHDYLGRRRFVPLSRFRTTKNDPLTKYLKFTEMFRMLIYHYSLTN